jgi:hypothetical protein
VIAVGLKIEGAVPARDAESAILHKIAKKSNRRNRVKTTLFAATLVVALTLSAAAATKRPALSQHLAGSNTGGTQFSGHSVPPPLCDPCLFYSGDLNPADPNAAGMSDENTLLIIGGSSTYGAFEPTESVTVTGILVNIQASANFDPLTATYDIRTGVSEGDGGTSIASGTANTTVQATGRNFIGLNEYTVAVTLSSPVLLSAGEYWINVTPACVNGASDGSCNNGRMFVSNTTEKTNNISGQYQPAHSMFLNSSFFGFTWANWCDPDIGFNLRQCTGMSFGLTGTPSQD